MKHLTIKDLPRIERPREKLIRYGPEKLNNSELLALILRTGQKGENVISLSRRILGKITSDKLPFTDYKSFERIRGLGPTKVCQIIACFELGKRLLLNKKVSIFLKPEDIFNELREIRIARKEHFVTLFLDTRNQEIKRETICVGSLNMNIIHPREVFEPAIKCNTSQIIITHNHPSGNPEPSAEDVLVTKRLIKAGELLGIEILDHIIVTKNNFLSFREKGYIT